MPTRVFKHALETKKSLLNLLLSITTMVFIGFAPAGCNDGPQDSKTMSNTLEQERTRDGGSGESSDSDNIYQGDEDDNEDEEGEQFEEATNYSGVKWNSVAVAGDSNGNPGVICGVDDKGKMFCSGIVNYSVHNEFGTTHEKMITRSPARMNSRDDWEMISLGARNRVCAIRSDSTLWCAGESLSDRHFVQIGDDGDWTFVDVGLSHYCALKKDGSLWCWGENSDGQLGVGDTSPRAEPTQVAPGSQWDSVAVTLEDEYGSNHTCGIQVGGSLWCWGKNNAGQLGQGSFDQQSIPTRVYEADPNTVTQWLAVDVGSRRTCAIRNNQTLWCWGAPYPDDAASPSFQPSSNVPVQIGSDDGWNEVVVETNIIGSEDRFGCGRKADGSFWCWGLIRGSKYAETPEVIDSTRVWSSVHRDGCATDEFGILFCLEPAGADQFEMQEAIPSSRDWEIAAPGEIHTCGITVGELYCWGEVSLNGGAGGHTIDYDIPRQVGTASTWMNVDTAYHHSCGIRANGSLWCWGGNDAGQLGDGTVNYSAEPKQVGSDEDWQTVATGLAFTCAIKQNGTLWCWGHDSISNPENSNDIRRPEQVGSASNWKSIFAGDLQVCAIDTDSTLFCWGHNGRGQIGDGTTVDRQVPTKVNGAASWEMVALGGGGDFLCGIQTDSSLWCWGDNTRGQLGGATSSDFQTVPLEVASNGLQGTKWHSVAVGRGHVCGTDTENYLWCWGTNIYGQQGIGSSYSAEGGNSPHKLNVPNWVSSNGRLEVSSYYWHTCLIQESEGKLFCWGRNEEGQLGTDGESGNSCCGANFKSSPVEVH